MQETEWRNQAQQDGYDEVITIDWGAGLFNDTHTHDFRVNLFIVSGGMMVTIGDEEIACCVGYNRTLDAGLPHSELVGPDGVSFLLARKTG